MSPFKAERDASIGCARCPKAKENRAGSHHGGINVEDARVNRLFTLPRAGRVSRRQLLETGLRLGLASPVIMSLIEAAPKTASAAPTTPQVRLDALTAQEESSGTLTLL